MLNLSLNNWSPPNLTFSLSYGWLRGIRTYRTQLQIKLNQTIINKWISELYHNNSNTSHRKDKIVKYLQNVASSDTETTPTDKLVPRFPSTWWLNKELKTPSPRPITTKELTSTEITMQQIPGWSRSAHHAWHSTCQLSTKVGGVTTNINTNWARNPGRHCPAANSAA